MDLKLEGKRALITGASRGIGRAIALELAREGAELCLVARDAAALGAFANELAAEFGTRVGVLAGDLRAEGSVDSVASHFGSVDILVNNAGDIPHAPLAEIDAQRWRHAWELKVLGYIDLTRRIYASMKEQGQGVIVNVIGIVGGKMMMSDYIAGSAGNAALEGFTRALGSSSPDDGIRVIGVHPGLILTDRQIVRWQKTAGERFGDPARWPELTRGFPFGRLGQPAEVARAVAFLASDAASYITGTSLTIDGGFSERRRSPYQEVR